MYLYAEFGLFIRKLVSILKLASPSKNSIMSSFNKMSVDIYLPTYFYVGNNFPIKTKFGNAMAVCRPICNFIWLNFSKTYRKEKPYQHQSATLEFIWTSFCDKMVFAVLIWVRVSIEKYGIHALKGAFTQGFWTMQIKIETEKQLIFSSCPLDYVRTTHIFMVCKLICFFWAIVFAGKQFHWRKNIRKIL